MCYCCRELHLCGSRSWALASSGEGRPQEEGGGDGRLTRVSLAPCRAGRRDPPYWSQSRRCLVAAARGGWRWRPCPGSGRSRLRLGQQVWGVNEPLTLVSSPPTPSLSAAGTGPGGGRRRPWRRQR